MVLSSTSLKLGAIVTSVVVANKRGFLRGSDNASVLEAEAGLGTVQCADFPDFTLKKACGAADVKGKTISLKEVLKWGKEHKKEMNEWAKQPEVRKLEPGLTAEMETVQVQPKAESNDENERDKHQQRMEAMMGQVLTISAHPDALIGSCCPSSCC
ncbi:unnamed protein product [Amoebophrya sp. A25]|nr:unnamed protein product [Amoebophrya sp. A25]|eukprot:GSA25T00024845001.1